jgi:hypothetical protein
MLRLPLRAPDPPPDPPEFTDACKSLHRLQKELQNALGMFVCATDRLPKVGDSLYKVAADFSVWSGEGPPEHQLRIRTVQHLSTAFDTLNHSFLKPRVSAHVDTILTQWNAELEAIDRQRLEIVGSAREIAALKAAYDAEVKRKAADAASAAWEALGNGLHEREERIARFAATVATAELTQKAEIERATVTFTAIFAQYQRLVFGQLQKLRTFFSSEALHLAPPRAVSSPPPLVPADDEPGPPATGDDGD